MGFHWLVSTTIRLGIRLGGLGLKRDRGDKGDKGSVDNLKKSRKEGFETRIRVWGEILGCQWREDGWMRLGLGIGHTSWMRMVLLKL